MSYCEDTNSGAPHPMVAIQPARTGGDQYQAYVDHNVRCGRIAPRLLDVEFADALSDMFHAPDELVEGVLTQDGTSMLFGASNSGKTFLAVDLACSVARGSPWLGRRTEPGWVVYLAAEAPASIRSRVQAYQRRHKTTVRKLAIVKSPVDLFGDYDAAKVIDLVKDIERVTGEKVRLIVGDTLARLSAGANENAGQDMGLIVQRVDRIRHECSAHFMLVHHSGKSAAAGARGWSGLRAAVDTEIEVTESGSAHCAQLTKQRDLPGRGTRVGFRLEPVPMGLSKWGTPVSSCVVVPAEVQTQSKATRGASKIRGAILSVLKAQRGQPMSKGDLVRQLDGTCSTSAAYRALRKLTDGKMPSVQERDGIVWINSDAPGEAAGAGASAD